MTVCKQCGEETKNPKFCSRSCRAKYCNPRRKPRTGESKKQTSESMKKLYEGEAGEQKKKASSDRMKGKHHRTGKKRKEYKCIDCGKEICAESIRCRPCYWASDDFQKNVGHYSSRFKKGYAYNKWTDTWEFLHSGLEFVYYASLVDDDIEWEKPKPLTYTSGMKEHLYFPDFYLVEEDKYIEVKGHWWQKDKEKMALVIEQHKDKKIEVLRPKDIEDFDLKELLEKNLIKIDWEPRKPLTEEQRKINKRIGAEKISAVHKGKPKSAEHRKKISESLKGRGSVGFKHSEETKQKMRENHRKGK